MSASSASAIIVMSDSTSCSGAVLGNAILVQWDRCSSTPLFLVGDRIASVPPPCPFTLDLRDHLVFPGLINAHDHLQLNAFPSLNHPAPFPDRLHAPAPPCPPKLGGAGGRGVQGSARLPQSGYFPDSYAWIAAFQAHPADPEIKSIRAIPADIRHWHGALKNLLSGVTTVAHHDPLHPIMEDAAFPVRVLREFGWSHSLGLGRSGSDRSPLCYGPPIPDSFAATPPEQPWIIHLAEGVNAGAAAELDELDALGCLAANTVLVHGVGLTARNIDRIIERQAAVIWCPGSNLTMLGQTVEPTRLLEAGRLALGSDSRISGSFDLLAELRLASEQPAVSPGELLRLVTEAGSRLLALPDVGGLDPGQRADLLIVRDTASHPAQVLLNLRRAEIRAVIRGGRPAIADPDFANWFAACGIAVSAVCLDGRPKLCATDLLGPPEVAMLEPGLEIQGRTYVTQADIFRSTPAE